MCTPNGLTKGPIFTSKSCPSPRTWRDGCSDAWACPLPGGWFCGFSVFRLPVVEPTGLSFGAAGSGGPFVARTVSCLELKRVVSDQRVWLTLRVMLQFVAWLGFQIITGPCCLPLKQPTDDRTNIDLNTCLATACRQGAAEVSLQASSLLQGRPSLDSLNVHSNLWSRPGRHPKLHRKHLTFNA